LWNYSWRKGMITLVWRTDVHLADKTPQSRTDDWVETVFSKLRQVGRIAEEVGASAVIDGGDFFHVKSPALTSHRIIREVAEIHGGYPCPTYVTVGNHDCVYGNIQFLPQQPLGVLFSTGVFRPLYEGHEAWFEGGGTKVRVVGLPYPGNIHEESLFDIPKGKEDFLVVVAHVLSSEKGGTLFEGEDIVRYRDLAGKDPDVWCMGHWHKDQGITEICPGKWVVNVGSLTRGSLSQDNLHRKPACVVLRFSSKGVELERRNLKVLPAVEAFDVAERAREETQSLTMDNFSKKVQAALNQFSDQQTLEDLVRSMKSIPPQVRERALLYLERS
jgi:DNA repair exonuclease SbcCD nuclease subunit